MRIRIQLTFVVLVLSIILGVSSGYAGFLKGKEINTGRGNSSVWFIELGNFNNDGNLDIIMGTPKENIVCLGDGKGGFPQIDRCPTASNYYPTSVSGDINNDGNLDLIVGDFGKILLYLGIGDGKFMEPKSLPIKIHDLKEEKFTLTASLAVNDINHDRNLDLIVSVSQHELPNMVYLGDGKGNFPTIKYFGLAKHDHGHGMDIGDINGDNNLDIVIGYYNDQNAIYFGDGRGNFPKVKYFGQQRSGHFYPSTNALVVEDVNNDGNLDILVGNDGSQNFIYFGDGKGNVSKVGKFGTGKDYTKSLILQDINNDGNLDIASTNYWQDVIYYGDGNGNFLDMKEFGSKNVYIFDMGDLNGDGRLDIITIDAIYLNVPFYVHILHKLRYLPVMLLLIALMCRLITGKWFYQ